MDAVYLLALGFIVGLSGAMMPGPLFVYTVAQSLRKGWKTGFSVILGHAAVEVALMLVLLLGVSELMSSQTFVKAISLLGGAFMMYTAWGLHRARWKLEDDGKAVKYGTITGGMLFTALNPGFTLWWMTAGAKLLLEGISNGGIPGAALVLAGHWGADFSYFTLVSALAAKGREKLLGRYVASVKDALALMLFAIGAYFAATGL